MGLGMMVMEVRVDLIEKGGVGVVAAIAAAIVTQIIIIQLMVTAARHAGVEGVVVGIHRRVVEEIGECGVVEAGGTKRWWMMMMMISMHTIMMDERLWALHRDLPPRQLWL